MAENRIWLYGKTKSELAAIAADMGMPRHAAAQMCSWLYKRGVDSIDAMTDISQRNRELLAARYQVGLASPTAVDESADGTKKYLFPALECGAAVETAYIPDGERATLCVSSQAGCRMGCRFCMTARQGLQYNLTSGEILNQMRSIPEGGGITNMVYMGMGEPMDNMDEVLRSLEILTSEWGYGWSPTRITVSTVGVIAQMRRLLESTKVNLAVSLHNPFHEQRMEMMPAEKAFPIREVVAALKEYDFSHQRRVSFEYIVFKGINDTKTHVDELARLLNGLKCRINLIRFHAIPGSPYASPGDKEMTAFRDAISRKGIICTIRASRGEDIKAACGLLSTNK
jgi:23S rRNA (adenine2503-C2)-methyltransferase